MAVESRFFCVRGYMKSGTNWICRLLNLHPDIECIGEFHWERMFDALQTNVDRIAPRRQQSLDQTVRPKLQQLVKDSLRDLAKTDATLIGDRTPAPIEPIVIDGAPQIVMVRDCRDVLVSRMFHLFNRTHVTDLFEKHPQMAEQLKHYQADPWFFHQHPEQLFAIEEVVRDSARVWAEVQTRNRESAERLSELPILVLKYEDLHQDFDRRLASVFDFLGVDGDAIEVPDSLTPGHDEENPQVLNRKGQIGDWRNYITNQAREWINAGAGEELQRLGYIDSYDWQL